MSRSKGRNRHAKPVKQTQSPPASSSPSLVAKSGGRHYDKQKTSKRSPWSSKVFKKHELHSESPQVGSSDHPTTVYERVKPRPFDSSRVKAQGLGSSHEHSLTPPGRWKMVYESDFEFKYKDGAQAQTQLQSQLTLESPPSSAQKVPRPPKSISVSDHEYGHASYEASSWDTDVESERGRKPVSPPQRVVDLESVTPMSYRAQQHKTREISVFSSIPESESGQGSVLPSPALSERVVDDEIITPSFHPCYGQQARESSTSDTDNESEASSEPFPSSPSRHTTTVLKRKRSNTDVDSRRQAVPLPALASSEHQSRFESAPILSELLRSLLSALDRHMDSGPPARDIRSQPWRKARDAKPLAWPPQLYSVIGSESPSKAGSEPEYKQSASECESDSQSLCSSTMTTPLSSPNLPLVASRALSQVLPPLALPQRWLPRLKTPGQKSSLSPTVWTLRLRPKCDIRPAEISLMIDGNKFRRLFEEFPPAAHENTEFMFSDDSDDSDFELPEAKLCRLSLSRKFSGQEQLTEREESLERGEPPELEESSSEQEESSVPEQWTESKVLPDPDQSSEAEQSSDPRQLPDPEPVLDLAPLLDLVKLAEREPLPALDRSSDPERSSGPESEHPRTPISIRDQLPLRGSRQLDKRIEMEIAIDKEENPKYWGTSFLREYERI
ncbi:hypothetical protein PENVUL_c052G03449 [Penicillium vulpinum]|uniref:Uncharacterized protein n=1 Tax=Penicillium vulpinum TaxID=29845 RepID=A0A1V6RG88_9EURO|nr:hypothetical protein PENVUL_c052G03449 [Penicillium vulpinum]